MALRIGIVVEAHPEDHSVDVVMTDDYSRLAGVQVLCSNGGYASGTADMAAPVKKSGDDKWSLAKRTAQDQKALIDFAGTMPVVVGFLYPQIGSMTFADAGRRVERHQSDVYETIDAAANYERYFPNGSFIRVAATPEHEDLTGKDVDGNWKIAKNTGAATHFRVVLGNAGAVKADIHIDPSGNLTGVFQGTGDITTIGNLTVNAANVTVNTATATVNASTKVELASPIVHCTGALNVDGKITGTAGMAISGGSGATVAGSMEITGGNVTADGIGLKTHHHVEHDGPSTGPAVA